MSGDFNNPGSSNVAFKVLVVTDLHCMQAGTNAGAGDYCQVRMASLLTEATKYGPYHGMINLGDVIHGDTGSGVLAAQMAPYVTFDAGIMAAYPSMWRAVVIGNHDINPSTCNTAQFLAACPGATTGDGNIVMGGDFIFYWLDVQVKNGFNSFALTTTQQNAVIAFLVANPTKKIIIGIHVPYAITKEIDRYYIKGGNINPRTVTAYSLFNDMMQDSLWWYTLEQTYPNLAATWCGHWHLTSGPADSDPTIERPQVIFPAVAGRNNIPPPNNTWVGQRGGFTIVTGFTTGQIVYEYKYFN